MKYLLTIFIFFSFFSQNSTIAQTGPAPEIDNTIRATVQLLMKPENGDFESFINNRYSKKLIDSNNLQLLVADLKKIGTATKGAGGIDVAMENDVFKLRFSEGNEANVILLFDQDESGKIRSIKLEEKKDTAQMTEEERFRSALEQTVQKIESLPSKVDLDEFEQFIKENFTVDFRSNSSMNELSDILKKTSLVVATSMTISAEPLENDHGNGLALEFRGPKPADVAFTLEEREPFRIQWFELNQNVKANEMDGNLIPMTRDNYRDQIATEVEKGFSGVIYMVRDGKIELAEGYGLADRKQDIKNTKNTVFDIGSIPIDFTRAAVLMLVDQGKINYDDPISRFVKDVPDDKKKITIGHLMKNESGLHNFHHDASKDKDYDLTWISREEAIKRILSRPLLAEPGTEVLPSHSGYGLLAAIVEIVSDQSYEDFLRNQFFQPMGIKATGPYGPDSGIAPERMAVGYGKQASNPNIPSEWGKISWLVKGSGGMVSNPGDLYLFYSELQAGKYFSTDSKEKFGFEGMSIGGSERGYFTAVLRDATNTVILCSNTDRSEYHDTMRLFRSLLKV